ncbi:hypothetical protein JCM16496A_21530 [Bacteroides rodentium JCM 16496]
MGKNKENLNIFLLHFLERLNSNEPNERKVIESLTDFCNYYDFTKGFIYQTDGFRYFLLQKNFNLSSKLVINNLCKFYVLTGYDLPTC